MFLELFKTKKKFRKIFNLPDYIILGRMLVGLAGLPRSHSCKRTSNHWGKFSVGFLITTSGHRFFWGRCRALKKTSGPHLKKYLIYKGLERLRAVGRFGGRWCAHQNDLLPSFLKNINAWIFPNRFDPSCSVFATMIAVMLLKFNFEHIYIKIASKNIFWKQCNQCLKKKTCLKRIR